MEQSFSGTHEYNPECLAGVSRNSYVAVGFAPEEVESVIRDKVDTVSNSIMRGICPRCAGPLRSAGPGAPAGSRITRCRCIPICSACGEDETSQQVLGQRLTAPWNWPVSRGSMTRRANSVKGRCGPAFAVADSNGDLLVLDDRGVTPLVNPPNTGGWNEDGFDR
ncbi:hypothetical protein [uncultured Phycicoccus sp.]|uniref:hypothetical protein n=1 Tax=uncultured Phycicoccus sp. TaxID=661422 RepID=UPI00261198B3|nr:hypothetical protein [uncultured Phycicoccus sp.]